MRLFALEYSWICQLRVAPGPVWWKHLRKFCHSSVVAGKRCPGIPCHVFSTKGASAQVSSLVFHDFCWTHVPKRQSQQDPNIPKLHEALAIQQTQQLKPLAIVTWHANHSSIDMYLINFKNHDVLCPSPSRSLAISFKCTSSLAFVACSAASFFSAVQRSSAWERNGCTNTDDVENVRKLKFYRNVPRNPALVSLRLRHCHRKR